ncbi:MAG TPA: Replication initiation and membrane attachment protein [Bacillus bacterium]|uniref:Replication initiation and membrane attachment protein n=1 Tax=Siminovitchia fordii TaxID=254759 RepID=A0ABQ4K8S3_9BACI|nr:replication initiation and membrane attachment family protein [Siminovitchia fordii]GIN22105.1 replication initiation and membrane attachment protein [Siminovitchia fordii]HBZ09396.1 Replication initiation and membrane attachment protein [Bacillus sp. (in: firmicutes)]
MKQYWNEVQPIDSFYAVMNGRICDHDKKVISFLYQPLMGMACTNLYTTLAYMVEENRLWSEEWNHYHLMELLGLNLDDIYQARLKLEGMGLLRTFIKEAADQRVYIYELQPPLSAEQFFTDGMLNIYLYQKVGQTHFLKLKRAFSDSAINKEEFAEVTRSFQDVYTSMSIHTLKNLEGQEYSSPDSNMRYIHREKAEPIHISTDSFNFDLLLSGLTTAMVPRKAFTSTVKDTIIKLSFLYSINEIDMQKVVLSSMTPDDKIDLDELRKAARDWYQMENDDQLPQLVNRKQPVMYRENDGAGVSKESKLIFYLETTSPRQLLIDLSEGAQPAMSDLTAVEEIMLGQQLEPGVMNVLIHYVMLKTDMKLSKNYMEKIASHWARKKIKTVKAAMELAKSEHRQYQTWANEKNERSQKRKTPIRTEKLPDWFIMQEQEQGEVKTKAPIVKHDQDFEERRRKLEAIQRKYRKDGGEKGGKHQ